MHQKQPPANVAVALAPPGAGVAAARGAAARAARPAIRTPARIPRCIGSSLSPPPLQPGGGGVEATRRKGGRIAVRPPRGGIVFRLNLNESREGSRRFCMNVPTQSPPPKKGMSPLAWIGIGCAVVIVLGIMAFGVLGFFAKRALDKVKDNPGMAAAELAVRANPDLELVSSDPKTNTLTVKNKKSGETVTFSGEDAKNGRFTVKTDKGTASFDASGSKDGGGTLKVNDEKGQTTTFQSGAAAVKNLPSWVPTYPGGTVQGTFDANTADGH